MHDFLPISEFARDVSYCTVCYLTLGAPSKDTAQSIESGGTVDQGSYIQEGGHMAFRQTLDPIMLGLSEKQRSRFWRALKRMRMKPGYHLTDLEPHIAHPIEDENLADICSCGDDDCPGACYDVHSWDRPSCLESILESKSKGQSP